MHHCPLTPFRKIQLLLTAWNEKLSAWFEVRLIITGFPPHSHHRKKKNEVLHILSFDYDVLCQVLIDRCYSFCKQFHADLFLSFAVNINLKGDLLSYGYGHVDFLRVNNHGKKFFEELIFFTENTKNLQDLKKILRVPHINTKSSSDQCAQFGTLKFLCMKLHA